MKKCLIIGVVVIIGLLSFFWLWGPFRQRMTPESPAAAASNEIAPLVETKAAQETAVMQANREAPGPRPFEGARATPAGNASELERMLAEQAVQARTNANLPSVPLHPGALPPVQPHE
jgi:hypothetical protein